MSRSLYYTHSGQTPLGATIKAALLAVVAGSVLGAFYGALSHYNPFIYVTVLANAGLAAAVGAAVGFACVKGHVRSPMQAMLLAALGGLVGVHFNWVAYILTASEFRLLSILPGQVLAVISELLPLGVWEIKGFAPKGLALAAIWGGEALLFVGVAAFVAHNWIKDATYCESCRDWVRNDPPRSRETSFPPLLPFDNPRAVISRLEAGDVSPLLDQPRAEPEAAHFLALKLLQCLRCDGVHLLTITETRFVGKEREKKEKVILPRLKISAENAEILLAAEETEQREEPVESQQV